MSTRQEYPPGSDKARKAGCTCPVLDNGHGHDLLSPLKRGVPSELFYGN